MKIFIVLCLVVASAAYKDPLSLILKSPKATLKLYSDFKSKQDLKFSLAEDRMRLRLFKKNAEFVASSNEVFEDSAEYELNFFSALTGDEKKQYLGLNVTNHLPNDDVPNMLSSVSAPSEKLWVNEGAVTEVKSQGSCGSCWTFAAVGGLETRYKALSGRLRNFAEQEYLDCVYESTAGKSGCSGGWPDNAYAYSARNGGVKASTADYPYVASDGSCKASSKPNSAVAYKIDGSTRIGSNEAANIVALASGSLSMAFEVTTHFQQYKGGIMKDTTCTGRINHGVTGVGYTANYVLVKNSWGSHWGEKGFVKYARNHDNCELFKYSSHAKLVATGSSDIGADDTATDYNPDDSVIPDDVCEDDSNNCRDEHCDSPLLAEKYCKKTCNLCPECASGTVKCPDGVCRHQHMC
ncbi:uncharacterized protein LOC134812650 [Bolinopsis microptera]|uniref:uncharacterized protein LOC134812650 n=1 Tax=Bolinopsis microptera TaxID=2820187 RepID=UPI00307A0ACD